MAQFGKIAQELVGKYKPPPPPPGGGGGYTSPTPGRGPGYYDPVVGWVADSPLPRGWKSPGYDPTPYGNPATAPTRGGTWPLPPQAAPPPAIPPVATQPAGTPLGGSPGGLGNLTGTPESLYPIDNPAQAVRNYLRNAGIIPNPFGPYANRAISQFSAGLPANFLGTMITAQPGNEPSNINEAFRNYVGRMFSGEWSPPSYAEAQQRLGGVNAALRGYTERLGAFRNAGESIDAAHARAMATGLPGLSPLQMSALGRFLTPEDQAAMLMSMYAPSLGMAGIQGLGRTIAPMQQLWSDILGEPEELAGRSFLDLLLGSLGGK